MNATTPADLLKLKARFETWCTNRKYLREPIPDELWGTAVDLSQHYPPALVGQFYAVRRSEARAREPFLPFSGLITASTHPTPLVFALVSIRSRRSPKILFDDAGDGSRQRIANQAAIAFSFVSL